MHGIQVHRGRRPAWDGIRWEGFCLDDQKGSRNTGTVSVAADLNVAVAEYKKQKATNHISKNMRLKLISEWDANSRLEPISEWDAPFVAVPSDHRRMRHSSRFARQPRRPWRSAKERSPPTTNSVSITGRFFRWIVATVEVRDPWGGKYPRIPTRRVPDPKPRTEGACDAAGAGMGGIHFIPEGQTIGSVRLFQSHKNVLPLVCFDTDVEDAGILMQIEEGLHSVFLDFFEEMP